MWGGKKIKTNQWLYWMCFEKGLRDPNLQIETAFPTPGRTLLPEKSSMYWQELKLKEQNFDDKHYCLLTFTRDTVLSLSQSGGRYHLAHLCSTPTILRYWRHSKATFAPHQPSWGTGRHTKPSCITFFYFYYWSVPLIFNHWAFMDSHSQFFTESLLHLQHKHGSWQDAHLLPQHLSLFLFSSFLSKAHFLPSPFHSRAPRNTNAQLQGSE